MNENTHKSLKMCEKNVLVPYLTVTHGVGMIFLLITASRTLAIIKV